MQNKPQITQKPLPTDLLAQLRTHAWMIVSLVCLLPLLGFDYTGFPTAFPSEFKVRLCLTLAALAAIAHRYCQNAHLPAANSGRYLAMIALIAACSYFNFGSLHGRTNIHAWEQFHYVLGAKYFKELQYDGLYAASIKAEDEFLQSHKRQPDTNRTIRDLRDNVLKPVSTLGAHIDEIRGRFDDARWRTFKDDHQFFLTHADRQNFIRDVRQDRGFNAPPTWVWQAQRIIAGRAYDETLARRLAYIDVVLLVGLFAALYWAFGSRVTCIALIVFGLNHCGRYAWVGGGLLRVDWLLCTVVSVCLLRKNCYLLAGLVLGWAASLRLFPVAFLFAPLVLALRSSVRGQSIKDSAWFFVGFTLSLVIAFVVGTQTGRGMDVWTDFYQAIALHKDTWLTNNVGLENLLLYDLNMMKGRYVDYSLIDGWTPWYAYMSSTREDMQIISTVLKATLLLCTAVAVWFMCDPSQRESAMVLGGLLVVFSLLITTNYYWQMLLLMAVFRSHIPVLVFLLLNAIVIVINLYSGSFEIRFAIFTGGLFVVLVSALVVFFLKGRSPAHAN